MSVESSDLIIIVPVNRIKIGLDCTILRYHDTHLSVGMNLILRLIGARHSRDIAVSIGDLELLIIAILHDVFSRAAIHLPSMFDSTRLECLVDEQTRLDGNQ